MLHRILKGKAYDRNPGLFLYMDFLFHSINIDIRVMKKKYVKQMLSAGIMM